MASYLDTSFMYKLYVNEDQSDRAVNWFRTYPDDVVISDLSDVEMTSSLYRRLPRERALSAH